jgi:NAD(P)-dependent dehydrogenase (short-subunit alcohol dehydrogenase family)
MARFVEKVALVTGGTSGIGRAAAVTFAREHASVVVTGRREAEGQETVRLVREAGGAGLFVRADVSLEADVRHVVEQSLKTFGRLDFAFNNAGVEEEPKPLAEQTEEEFERIFAINAKGVWLSMKYEVPEMLKLGGGVIVNNASVAGIRGSRQQARRHRADALGRSGACPLGHSGERPLPRPDRDRHDRPPAEVVASGDRGQDPDGAHRAAPRDGERRGLALFQERVVHHRPDHRGGWRPERRV